MSDYYELGKMNIYLLKRDALDACCNVLLIPYIKLAKTNHFLDVTQHVEAPLPLASRHTREPEVVNVN